MAAALASAVAMLTSTAATRIRTCMPTSIGFPGVARLPSILP